MSDNKLVKAVMDGAVLAAVITGIGWIGKNVLKVNFKSDPSTSFTNYLEFSAVTAGAIALKDYLVAQKIVPSNVLTSCAGAPFFYTPNKINS